MLDHHPGRSNGHRAVICGCPKPQNPFGGFRTGRNTFTETPTMLTQKRLREVLRYDPETGIFTWAKGKRRGKVAGTRHDGRGFLKVAIDNERHLLHRLAWLWMTGLHPHVSVEQINGDRSDNRWGNLRLGFKPQKAGHEAPRPQRTAYEGVVAVGDRFDALIQTDRYVLNLGSFATAEAARDALIVARREARQKQRERLRRAA